METANTEKKIKGLPDFVTKYPEHKVAIWAILKNNAGIRRLCSLNIINYLKRKGELAKELKVHVSLFLLELALLRLPISKEILPLDPYMIMVKSSLLIVFLLHLLILAMKRNLLSIIM